MSKSSPNKRKLDSVVEDIVPKEGDVTAYKRLIVASGSDKKDEIISGLRGIIKLVECQNTPQVIHIKETKEGPMSVYFNDDGIWLYCYVVMYDGTLRTNGCGTHIGNDRSEDGDRWRKKEAFNKAMGDDGSIVIKPAEGLF